MKRFKLPLTSLVVSLLLAVGAAAHAAGPAKPVVPHANKGSFPQITLPEQAQGQRAIDLLGTRLPEVAAWYGKSADEFKSLLLQDQRMRVDRRGRVFFVDEHEGPVPAASPTGADDGLLNGTLLPLDQTFLLHSRPAAKRTIYLNFKGATLVGTAWNNNGNTITALPFDLDGVPYSFSTAELQRIQYIWQRVSEDYAPFDVDVTTEAPPADRLTRSSATDDVFGTTVLITNSNGVYNCSCGGVAYLGVFDDTSDVYKPALVFYNQLAAGSEKAVAEAISHEAGHNMGLGHDGSATSGYYSGHGTGATGWAPIMGVGYNQPVVQWSRGEYAGANNVQDDFVVMQGNGLPLRADDHGDTAATATLLASVANGGGVSTASAQGVIERASDIDFFAFTAAAGAVSATLSPAARSANLDAVLTLHDAAGNAIISANPLDALNATLSLTLAAPGSYYLSVKGTGKGDPATSGYSSFGSVGQYGITLSHATPGNQAPVARIAASATSGVAPFAVTFSGAGSSDADGSVVAWDWNFGDGATASGASVAHTYGTPGSYSAQLRVTDNAGLSALSAVTVTVQPQVVVLAMRVADIAMSLTVNRGGNAQATAAVKLVDGNGLPVVGATVTGNWSGLVSLSGASAVTDSSGIARFTSPNSKRGGSFVFSVTGASLGGYSYAPGTNTETSDSIAR